MNRFGSILFFPAALPLGTGTTQAVLPSEATIYKNPQCGGCDEYARQLRSEASASPSSTT